MAHLGQVVKAGQVNSGQVKSGQLRSSQVSQVNSVQVVNMVDIIITWNYLRIALTN